MLESLFPSIRSGSTLVPANLIIPPGVSDNAQHRADLREMSISERVAAAVALKRLGYHVVTRSPACTPASRWRSRSSEVESTCW